MRIGKLLMLAVALLCASELRADTAGLEVINWPMAVAAQTTLHGATTIDPVSSDAPDDLVLYSRYIYTGVSNSGCGRRWKCPKQEPPRPRWPKPADVVTNVTQPPTTPAPEPASLALFGSGLIGIAAVIRRKMRASRR